MRRVRRRLMVPERDEPPNALGARDNVGPETLFRAQFAMRSLELCAGAWVAAMVENTNPQDYHKSQGHPGRWICRK